MTPTSSDRSTCTSNEISSLQYLSLDSVSRLVKWKNSNEQLLKRSREKQGVKQRTAGSERGGGGIATVLNKITL